MKLEWLRCIDSVNEKICEPIYKYLNTDNNKKVLRHMKEFISYVSWQRHHLVINEETNVDDFQKHQAPLIFQFHNKDFGLDVNIRVLYISPIHHFMVIRVNTVNMYKETDIIDVFMPRTILSLINIIIRHIINDDLNPDNADDLKEMKNMFRVTINNILQTSVFEKVKMDILSIDHVDRSMRDATKEETESVNTYIDSISKPTGVDFYN